MNVGQSIRTPRITKQSVIRLRSENSRSSCKTNLTVAWRPLSVDSCRDSATDRHSVIHLSTVLETELECGREPAITLIWLRRRYRNSISTVMGAWSMNWQVWCIARFISSSPQGKPIAFAIRITTSSSKFCKWRLWTNGRIDFGSTHCWKLAAKSQSCDGLMQVEVMMTPWGSEEWGRFRSMYSRPAGEASSKMYKNLTSDQQKHESEIRSNTYWTPSRCLHRAEATSWGAERNSNFSLKLKSILAYWMKLDRAFSGDLQSMRFQWKHKPRLCREIWMRLTIWMDWKVFQFHTDRKAEKIESCCQNEIDS